ncbi:MAG TPA: MarR family transcriptional regulator [Jatrophihabitantaceae bacterium]
MTRFAGGPAQSPGFLLWHLTLRWQRTITAALAPLDLTHVQFVLLACTYWLTEQGHRPNQQQVAAQAGTDVKMTSQVLRRLEARRLISRRTDEGDTRAKTLSMTRRGRSLAIEAITVVEDADAAFFAEYPASLIRALARASAPGTNAEAVGSSRGSR